LNIIDRLHANVTSTSKRLTYDNFLHLRPEWDSLFAQFIEQ